MRTQSSSRMWWASRSQTPARSCLRHPRSSDGGDRAVDRWRAALCRRHWRADKLTPQSRDDAQLARVFRRLTVKQLRRGRSHDLFDRRAVVFQPNKITVIRLVTRLFEGAIVVARVRFRIDRDAGQLPDPGEPLKERTARIGIRQTRFARPGREIESRRQPLLTF